MTQIVRLKLESIYKRLYDLCVHLFSYLPVQKRKIVFIEGGKGGGYRCNLKYIAEEIRHQGLPYKMSWVAEKESQEIPSYIRRVKYNRIKTLYELATAQVIINNSKSIFPVIKKEGQTFIYIPHGQPGCKCAEGDAVLPESWIRNSREHSRLTDVFISMSKYHTQVLKDTFWVHENAEIWEIGFPRNDQFYSDTVQKQKYIRKILHVPENVRIALYAPTFRDSGTTGAYNLDLHRVLNTLERKTNDKWIMFVTLHPNFKWFKVPPYPFNERIWNMSDYEDIHELMLAVDICISDYSSTSLDFSNTRRPVFLYASDIDLYTKMRGLKPMFYKLPFPVAKNNEEMESLILAYNKEEYLREFEKWMKDSYGSYDDGHAAKRFVKKLEKIIG